MKTTLFRAVINTLRRRRPATGNQPPPNRADERADGFARRVLLYGDACELVEIAVRRQLLGGHIGTADRGAYRTIAGRLHDNQLDFLVTFLANVCGELTTALAEHSEVSVDAIVAQIHESAADTITEAECRLRAMGYLP